MKINKCCNKNDQRTLNILKKNNKGLTAYDVLSELQKHKNIKPPSIAICKSCGDTEELKSEIFETIFKKNPIKKYDLSKFQIEVSAICRRCN